MIQLHSLHYFQLFQPVRKVQGIWSLAKVAYSLTHSFTHSLTHSLTHTHTHTHTLSLSLSLTHTHKLLFSPKYPEGDDLNNALSAHKPNTYDSVAYSETFFPPPPPPPPGKVASPLYQTKLHAKLSSLLFQEALNRFPVPNQVTSGY